MVAVRRRIRGSCGALALPLADITPTNKPRYRWTAANERTHTRCRVATTGRGQCPWCWHCTGGWGRGQVRSGCRVSLCGRPRQCRSALEEKRGNGRRDLLTHPTDPHAFTVWMHCSACGAKKIPRSLRSCPCSSKSSQSPTRESIASRRAKRGRLRSPRNLEPPFRPRRRKRVSRRWSCRPPPDRRRVLSSAAPGSGPPSRIIHAHLR